VEDDTCEPIEIPDQEREEADVQRLPDQPCDDVLVGSERPKQAGERNVERNQCRRQKSHVASEQAEAGIDVGGKDLKEAIDDASPLHRQRPSELVCGGWLKGGVAIGSRSMSVFGVAAGVFCVELNRSIGRPS